MTEMQGFETLPQDGVDIGAGVMMHHAVTYGAAVLHGNVKRLRVDLYCPPSREAQTPIVVWFHSGAFRSGGHSRVAHKVMARWLGKHGIALATPEYRLGAIKSDLSRAGLSKLDDLRNLRSRTFRRDLAQARSIAALEDSCVFLTWLHDAAADMGINDKMVIAGGSAGAINAFNVCFTSPFLGLHQPASIGGILSFSGGYAYPSLFKPGKVPIFAAHNPDDDRVDIGSIRHLSRLDPDIELVETNEQDHGEVRLWRGEKKAQAFARFSERVWRMSGLTPP